MADVRNRMIHRDPKLENLRAEVLAENAPPDINPISEDLMEKTRRIHAGFLFDAKYGDCETWRLLMSNLCATSTTSGNLIGDWKAFCNLLGFERPIIESIGNVKPNSEDPVTNTLAAFSQRDGATLSQVVSALKQMGREDLLLIINQPLTELAEAVLRDHEIVDNSNMGDSGYLSNSQDQAELESIIIPKFIPFVPCLLKEKSQLSNALLKVESSTVLNTKNQQSTNNIPVKMTNITPNFNPPIEQENYVNASPSNSSTTMPSRPKQNLSCVVMLTFAADGQDTAAELARTLREPREGDKRCGVLVLQEQLAAVNQDPIAFIGGCYKKVDYVVPILTPGYLRSIKADVNTEMSPECIDAYYVRYVYRMILDEFTNNNCMNRRVRSIIPDHHVKQVSKYIVNLPVFQAYNKISNSDNFARKLVNGRI